MQRLRWIDAWRQRNHLLLLKLEMESTMGHEVEFDTAINIMRAQLRRAI
jgi:hypothetical protein